MEIGSEDVFRLLPTSRKSCKRVGSHFSMIFVGSELTLLLETLCAGATVLFSIIFFDFPIIPTVAGLGGECFSLIFTVSTRHI